MDWAGVAKAALWLALAGLVVLGIWKIKRSGRVEERLDQAKATIEEAGDAAENRRRVDAARGVERDDLRKKWTKHE